MRKLFSILLAAMLIVSIAGYSQAQGIVDTDAGPYYEVTSVYNNSGGTLDVGDVVIWDIGSSTGDDDQYVTTTTSADTFLVAGVVYPADIAASSSGSIVTKGAVTVDVATSNNINSAGALLCTGTTAGGAAVCSNGQDDGNAFGFTTATVSSSTVKAYLFGK